jgi:hypothetical protein
MKEKIPAGNIHKELDTQIRPDTEKKYLGHFGDSNRECRISNYG